MLHDDELIRRLRSGDEDAFAALVDSLHHALMRTALVYVDNPAAAEDVVQETWIAVLKGLDRFQGRSSLKTWIFSILINRAKTAAQREGRYEHLPDDTAETASAAVSADRFHSADHPNAGWWKTYPESWEPLPEEQVMSGEVRTVIEGVIAALPLLQRLTITMRDIDGFSAEEVCHILSITEVNQRVLLHRARTQVRGALETYFEGKRR